MVALVAAPAAMRKRDYQKTNKTETQKQTKQNITYKTNKT